MDQDISRILKAARFAAEKHKNQRRKGAETSPYINHSLKVAEILCLIGEVRDPDCIVAALLHDTVEDTATTFTELEENFGTNVSNFVKEVTDDKTLQKQQRKDLQVAHAPHLSPGAKQIKLADKIANIFDVGFDPAPDWSIERRREYLEHATSVVERLRGCNPKLEAEFDAQSQRTEKQLVETQSPNILRSTNPPMGATFIGIDLAWISTKNPSGFAVLTGNDSMAELTACETVSTQGSVADLVLAHAASTSIVAIDAPLIINNQTGQRLCENQVGRRYGSREASCHTTNMGRYPNSTSVALTSELISHGYTHCDLVNHDCSKIILEVYPHAAMVALWDLPKTIKYKKGDSAAKRAGLEILKTYLWKLTEAEPRLAPTQTLGELLNQDLSMWSGQRLKDYEDKLDAVFCAYLAMYFWRWRSERNEMFGDLVGGYIINPKLRNLI